MWVCLSTSNISLLTQYVSAHTITGNVVDIWNVCMAFWESGLKEDWPGRCYKYLVCVQMLYPFLQMLGISLFIEKQMLKKPAEVSVRGKKGWDVPPACIHVASRGYGTGSGHQSADIKVHALNLWAKL